MRLIAEGFGEDDDTEDSQLRSSAVYGKYSASYISGKLCDVAETHPSDDTVQAYAVTALMKVFSFEKATGRSIDMLPEVPLKKENGQTTVVPLYQSQETIVGKISVEPVQGKKVEHNGIKIELLGQIG
ncbi:hypothetical protein L1987_71948 [Smallanthus sonchifolius]|uniref:Uncharacterized protein n=1 Tax=Smallanthus sonchifolius TaxID=185202 RepID=A0ACB9AUI9_9ASTR|nr:hypothetical protein L1987_71948 [Smallanthus sonchifolius]